MTRDQIHDKFLRLLQLRANLACAQQQYDELFFEVWDEIKQHYNNTTESRKT